MRKFYQMIFGVLVLSALLPETIAGRVQGSAQMQEDSGVEGTDER